MRAQWLVLLEGQNRNDVTRQLDGLDADAKQGLLRERGIDGAQVPLWQKRGALASWHRFEKIGFDPRLGEVTVTRRRIGVNEELLAGEA